MTVAHGSAAFTTCVRAVHQVAQVGQVRAQLSQRQFGDGPQEPVAKNGGWTALPLRDLLEVNELRVGGASGIRFRPILGSVEPLSEVHAPTLARCSTVRKHIATQEAKAKCLRFAIMKIDETRVVNARFLAAEVGGHASFAATIDRDPAYVSQLIGENPKRNIGSRMARHIESRFGRNEGWLDVPHPPGNVSPVESAPLKGVPLVSYVQAGMMLEMVNPYSLGDGMQTITTDADVSDLAFALEIRGDSMEPEFKEGDRVIIDPTVHPRPGDFVAARNGGDEATFKKYRERGTGASGGTIFELVPLNENYPVLRSDTDGLRIIGTMIEHRRYRRRK